MELVFWQLKNSHYYKEYLKEVKTINYYLNPPRNSFTGKFVFPSRREHFFSFNRRKNSDFFRPSESIEPLFIIPP